MAITTRSEYGLRAMILLAEQLGEERLSASEIARREQIPLKYLERILRELKRAGLVRSHAGARGGYHLARAASTIAVGEVVAVLDGPVSPARCVDLGQPAPESDLRLRPLWHKLRAAMCTVLDGTTLDQLAFGARLEGGGSPGAGSAEGAAAAGSDEDDDQSAGGPRYHI